jgi:hypothetical protein
MHFITRKHLSRRTLLRGAGASLALPLLDAMVPAATLGASAAGVPQTRLAFLYMAHGAVMDRWNPVGDGADFELGPTMQSLQPFRQSLNIISDLTLPSAYGADASAGANHMRSSATWLTCMPPGTGPSPASVDQLAATIIGQDTPMPSLELTLEEGSSIAWLTPTTPMPMEPNPQVVFERLFGDGSTPAERTARHDLKASLLDSVAADVGDLKRRLPAGDKIRLDRYLEDVREIERRLALVAASDVDSLEVPDKPQGIPASFTQHAHLMFDLMVLAWQAEITRVSTMQLVREISNRVFAESGITDPFHNLSHHSEVQANKDKLAQLNEFHVRTTLGYLLKKLQDTPDGDGNLLDHAMVVYGSGMSNSNQHDHTPLPIILAGGASGRLRGGRHIRAGRSTPMANLLHAMLDKIDAPVTGFADSTGALTL